MYFKKNFGSKLRHILYYTVYIHVGSQQRLFEINQSKTLD